MSSRLQRGSVDVMRDSEEELLLLNLLNAYGDDNTAGGLPLGGLVGYSNTTEMMPSAVCDCLANRSMSVDCQRQFLTNQYNLTLLHSWQLLACNHQQPLSIHQVCCVTFAESEPYCHSILFVCLSGCLSVIPRPTAYHD